MSNIVQTQNDKHKKMELIKKEKNFVKGIWIYGTDWTSKAICKPIYYLNYFCFTDSVVYIVFLSLWWPIDFFARWYDSTLYSIKM